MKPPEDMNDLLRTLHQGSDNADTDGGTQLADSDEAFIQKMLDRIRSGASNVRAVFITLGDDNRMQYITVNTSRRGAERLLTRVLTRLQENNDAESC